MSVFSGIMRTVILALASGLDFCLACFQFMAMGSTVANDGGDCRPDRRASYESSVFHRPLLGNGR